MNSVLDTIKGMLGIDTTVTSFDTDITININTVLMSLRQIGIGPKTGYRITTNADKWSDFIGEEVDLEGVKTYVYLRVKLLFDPPASSYVVEAFERQLNEIEFRLLITEEVERPALIPVEGEV